MAVVRRILLRTVAPSLTASVVVAALMLTGVGGVRNGDLVLNPTAALYFAAGVSLLALVPIMRALVLKLDGGPFWSAVRLPIVSAIVMAAIAAALLLPPLCLATCSLNLDLRLIAIAVSGGTAAVFAALFQVFDRLAVRLATCSRGHEHA